MCRPTTSRSDTNLPQLLESAISDRHVLLVLRQLVQRLDPGPVCRRPYAPYSIRRFDIKSYRLQERVPRSNPPPIQNEIFSRVAVVAIAIHSEAQGTFRLRQESHFLSNDNTVLSRFSHACLARHSLHLPKEPIQFFRSPHAP